MAADTGSGGVSGLDSEVELVSTSEADLGLGRGLKPGGIPRQREDVDRYTVVQVMKHVTGEEKRPKDVTGTPGQVNTQPRRSSAECALPPAKHRPRRLSDRFRLLRRGTKADRDTSDEAEVFPTYAEVPLGTSLRQQKKLYEDSIDQLFLKNEETVTRIKECKSLSIQ